MFSLLIIRTINACKLYTTFNSVIKNSTIPARIYLKSDSTIDL